MRRVWRLRGVAISLSDLRDGRCPRRDIPTHYADGALEGGERPLAPYRRCEVGSTLLLAPNADDNVLRSHYPKT